MLKTSELDYDLPEELIATEAAEPRDAARLMVVSRSDPSLLVHTHVRDIGTHLRAGDRLILNATRVLRARLMGKKPSGGKVEGLFLSTGSRPGTWITMLGASHLHPGTRVDLLAENDAPAGIHLELINKLTHEPGAWEVAVHGADASEPAAAVLERIGRTPLPPYILKARKRHDVHVQDTADRARYQTVFSTSSPQLDVPIAGSVAAPTAGLHFTPDLLAALAAKGVTRSEVTLHVGTGTFRTVETDTIEAHPMHSEWCTMSDTTQTQIAQTRAQPSPHRGRIICVGTTSARTVESFAREHEQGRHPSWLETRILISPGYRWRWTDGMLTNFHLPRSTLMAMIGALLEPSGGVARLRELYEIAKNERYRFYSFGDAMLILP